MAYSEITLSRLKKISPFVTLVVMFALGFQFFNDFVVYGLMDEGVTIAEVFSVQGEHLYYSLSFLIFVVIFKYIFGDTPLLFFYSLSKGREISISGSGNVINVSNSENEGTLKTPNTELYLTQLTDESKLLAERIFNRSGAYLLVGCVIAFGGIGYFSIYALEVLSDDTLDISFSDRLLQFAPRFGALLFIEFIAFFFLKQYRITMDEYKYYEAIKRNRQSNLAIFKFLSENRELDPEDIESILSHYQFFGGIDKLGENETTESLEARKYSNEEMDVFNKIIDKIGK